jgi:hypothetical protein
MGENAGQKLSIPGLFQASFAAPRRWHIDCVDEDK